MKQFMNQVFGFVDKNLKWFGAGILGTFYLFKLLVIIGTMADVGSFGYILVALIDLVIVTGLVGAGFLCLFTDRKEQLGKLALGYLTYFVVLKSLTLSSTASVAAEMKDALPTTWAVFSVLAGLTILGVLVLYILEMFMPKVSALMKYIGFGFLGYFAFSIIVYALGTAMNAKYAFAWYHYFNDINNCLVLPLLVLGMYFVCAKDKLMGAAAPAAEPEVKEEAPVEEAKPEEEKPAE